MKWTTHNTSNELFYELNVGFTKLIIAKQKYGQHKGRWQIYDSAGVIEPTNFSGDDSSYKLKLDAVALMRMALSSVVAELERFAEV
jgi:hypothetical protein